MIERVAYGYESSFAESESAAPRSLEQVVETFRKWLHLPDPGALYVTLATVAANRMPGDPVWLLLVAASSGGKTETLFALSGLDEVAPAATLTESALLSGVPKKEHAAGAKGGLLRQIGDYGILTLKDFGSVLSMHRDARAAVLAALRELYDGSWDRPIGSDGGKVLHWEGKLGLIAGVTSVVDTHHGVMDALGSRFAQYRIDVADRKKQARRSLSHRSSAQIMRGELREAVTGFFGGLELPEEPPDLTEDEVERLVTLADFVTIARSPVERDTRNTREIELVPDAEAPGRFVGMLAALLEGLRLIGVDEETRWSLVVKVAFDSMPAQRRQVIELLARRDEAAKTAEVGTSLGLPTSTAKRTLEDLAAHGILERQKQGEGSTSPDLWRLTDGKRAEYAAAVAGPQIDEEDIPF
jgi:DNA-binding MarR family transcriptional regulator